jgi:tRNA nucleotidyltransferase (CCA-adding enzyme)
MNSSNDKKDTTDNQAQTTPQLGDGEVQSALAPVWNIASSHDEGQSQGNTTTNKVAATASTSTFLEYSTKITMAATNGSDKGQKYSNTEQLNQRIINICISDPEKQLLELLNDVTDRYNRQITNNESSELLTVRIAGGWVRDKILGYPYDQNTNDIDIAINIISGVQFAELVQSYFLTHPEQATDKSSSNSAQPLNPNLHKMGVIAANPEQSKHLETACMKLYDIDIDFTNLRCHEVYSNPDNRIPDTTIQFGTPHSDAYRRDFTINSLYYNVQTTMIEDYTTRGLHDLHNRYLQTPLDPQVTFVDDPLRILRAIRFAIRFQLSMDDRIVTAAQDQSIQMALQNKVSRERVGKELEGMLSGKCANPVAALQTIYRLRLSSCIFSLPTPGINCKSISGTFRGTTYTLKPDSMSHSTMLNNWDESIFLLSVFSATLELLAVQEQTFNSKSKHLMEYSRLNQRLLPLAVYLLPFHQLSYIEIPKNSAASFKEFNVITFIMKDSIKFKNLDVQAMSAILRNIDSMMELLQKYSNDMLPTAEAKDNGIRLRIGTILCDAKELWVTILLLAGVLLIGRNHKGAAYSVDAEPESRPSAIECKVWLNRCNALYHDILYKFELDNCWNTIRPIMNGQELIRELNLPKGPTVGLYMEEQMKYLIRFPASTKQECLQYLQDLDKAAVSLPLDSKVPNKKKKTKT